MVNYLPLLWKDTCKIQTIVEVTKPSGATAHTWDVLVENEPCKLSFSNNQKMNSPAVGSERAAEVFQQIKLFLRVDLDVPPGSRIEVITHNGKTLYFKASGIPVLFTNHQEIILEMDKQWA